MKPRFNKQYTHPWGTEVILYQNRHWTLRLFRVNKNMSIENVLNEHTQRYIFTPLNKILQIPALLKFKLTNKNKRLKFIEYIIVDSNKWNPIKKLIAK